MKNNEQAYLPDVVKQGDPIYSDCMLGQAIDRGLVTGELKCLKYTDKTECRRLKGDLAVFWRQIGMTLILLLFFLLTGCGQQPAAGKETAGGAEKGGTTQPYTVTDDAGRRINLKEKPCRIVSVTYGTDEILEALAGPGRMQAYSRHAGDPEISFLRKEDVAAVGKQVQENTEEIFALQPDLVVVSRATPPDMLYAMEQMGLTVYVAASPKNYDQMKQKVWNLGAAVGETEKAKALLARMDTRRRRLAQRLSMIPENQRKIVVAFTTSGPMGRKGDLFDSMLQEAHVINGVAIVTPLGLRGQISKEQVVEVDPDIFLLPTWNYDKHQDIQKFNREIAEDPAFRNVKAVRDGKLLPVSDRYRYVASHHIVEAIENIAYTVYPEVFPERKPTEQE